jgi:phage I-like protein
MKRKTSLLQALCSVVAMPHGDGVPDWVHLLPAGAVRTMDGRGPYSVKSLQAIATASLPAGGKLPIDECHAIDRAQPLGMSAPARGWIVELQAREDGLWGRVEWTPTGRQLMEDKAYVGISPAILHTQQGQVLQVLRASLTNTPNLQGLTSLHTENTTMDWRTKLIEQLGLDGEADDAAIQAALSAKTSAVQTEHSQNLLQHPAVLALQSEVADLTGRLQGLQEDGERAAATAFVDAAIAAGRVGVKPLREDYIALHMENADRAQKLINAQPAVIGTAVADGAVSQGEGTGGLTAEDRLVMSTFGIDEAAYRESLVAAGLMKGAI